jgi:molybdopterin molybdotransferase
LPATSVALGISVQGLVLAEDVASDIDSPPFDKSMMDGYAIQSTDLAEGKATLEVIEEISAGKSPSRSVGPGQTIRIMTGAPIPEGADAVIQVERSRDLPDNRVLLESKAQPGQNILRRAQEMKHGQVVLRSGCRLRPQEIGVLAAVGRSSVQVHPVPVVAVLPTGDEIVEVHERPGPAQIRNSNGPMLEAQVARAGGVPRFLGIARDRMDHLRSLIQQGLESDVLILSGGVSAGKLDLVPGVLAECGVQDVFHKVAMKPGKPIYFGTSRRPGTHSDQPSTLVFGLPGNPVSSMVCFELFVRPVIERLLALPEPGPCWIDAILDEDFAYRTDRPTYHPARLRAESGGWRVRAVPWQGSPDLRGLTAANALVLFSPGDHVHKAGQVLPTLKME